MSVTWRSIACTQLWLVAAVQALALSVWFSAAAVVPALVEEWRISDGDAAWLTGAVQLGFVAGAVVSAVVNLADRVPLARLIAVGAVGAAAANGLLLAFPSLAAAIPLRFATGMALALVYPPGVKLLATWFFRGRGYAIGVLVAALTLGSAAPQLVASLVTLEWRRTVAATTALALAAALVALRLREGPHCPAGASLRPGYVVEMFRDRTQRLVNLGYFGHMWELYAFWTWLPAYLTAALSTSGRETPRIGVLSFAVIGLAGAAGCVTAGVAAGRVGSVRVAHWALATSGVACLASGLLFAAPPWLLVAALAVWGFAVIADSAQFSAALSKVADQRYVGTAVTAQMAMGFLLTAVTIRLLPPVADAVGWQWAMTTLAAGPLIGVAALRRLIREEAPAAEPAALRSPAG